MGLTWSFNSDATGYKVLQATISDGVAGTGIVEKFDGSIVNPVADSTSFTGGDQQYLSTTNLYLSVSDTDSGWLEAWTGTELTSDWIKSFVTNGWQYTGDGTTDSWVSVVDGTAPSTNTLTYVSANKAPDYTNYLLHYQLVNEVEEPITVEGSLKINGDAQVEVNSGGEYFESLTPDTTGQTTLAHSASEVFGVYDGSAYVDFTVVDADNIQITDYDDTKSYTANYMRQDKYNFTTNMNDVTVHYASSLKDSVDRAITKQSDIAEEVSILDRQVYNLLIEARNNGWSV